MFKIFYSFKNISDNKLFKQLSKFHYKFLDYSQKSKLLYHKLLYSLKGFKKLKHFSYLPILVGFSYLTKSKLYCYSASNKELEKMMNSLDREIKNLEFKYQGKLRRQPISHGIRNIRLYVEFPINQANVDVNAIINKVISSFESQKVKFNYKQIDSNIVTEDDMFSYKLDYEIMSSATPGAKNKGTVYLRGTKGRVYDNFMFTFEKQNDFTDLEVNAFLAAYEEAFKPGKNNQNKKTMNNNSTYDNKQEGSANDPISVLHKYGVSVFLPGGEGKKDLDWDYLAGYENVKRLIEDSVLLGLTHGEIYDMITAGTRMKNETNRPKAILFEGPPGTGKTTSAKIIANQVNIPLIYMPIESIMSKYYGESETRFAEIFEAAKGMGRSIIFIDEIDALATSREGGIHEATRRILSTLLRKIDSFESDGEVLLICATNRSKDLDPALLSRLDITIKFDLPDQRMRSLIFQRYAKHLSQGELEDLGNLSQELSGRDIADICKDAERRWAAMYIRKEKKTLLPEFDIYKECLEQRKQQMKNVNKQFEMNEKPYWMNK
jgi:SpoVK/Ycf46/Vps4 family AAA+-type ATPase